MRKSGAQPQWRKAKKTQAAQRKPAVNSERGAVQSKSSFGDLTESYFSHHRSSLVSSFKRLLSTPLQTVMTSMVVAIALALPATLLVAINNIQQLGDSWDMEPKMSVFINLRAKPAAIEQLERKFSTMPEIKSLVFLSAEEALAEFKQVSGFGDALSGLDSNPLPATFILTPSDLAAEPERFYALGDKIASEAIVDDVSLDLEWVKRLRELMSLGKKIVLALALLLGLGVLLAIGNTIRLAIENRREEIVVAKLVGGTDGFVRRPFLYSGGWYGFLGGVLACTIVTLAFASLSGSVSRLAELYQGDYQLFGLGFTGNMQLLLISSLIGWLGAWLAVGRHLSDIEPR